LLAGIGSFIAIGALAHGETGLGLPLVVAPFGASCALVFGAPSSQLAKPRNVIGGHLISAALGLLAASLIASPALAMAAGVGLAIAGMLLTDTLHPPAGADPIVVVLSHAPLSFLLMPVLVGTLSIVLIGALYHRLVTGHGYP
jgi:CBS-domain-containing membrane protein